MNAEIRVVTSPGEAHVAVTRDGRLIDYALWRPGAPDGVGDIHRGRVTAMLPTMAGAFVALAEGEGFLPDSEGAKGLSVGATVTARITRAAQAGKGPRLSLRGTGVEATPGPVALLKRGPTPLEVLTSRHADAAVLVDQPALAAELRAQLGTRLDLTQDMLSDEVAGAIEALSRPCVELLGGVRLSIWPTPALVAIDMDAAGALSRGQHPALNRAALPWLAEQIRLRNLSGAIIVDVAGLSARKRAALAPDFTAALSNDPLRPKFLGFTALGMAEIVRPRVRPPLHELLGSPLAAGLAGLRALLAACRQDPRSLPALRAHPAIVSALRADPVALPDLLRRTGRDATLRSDPSLPEMAWMTEKDDG